MKKLLWLLPYLLTGMIAGIVSGLFVRFHSQEQTKELPITIQIYENELTSLDQKIDSIRRAVLPSDSASMQYIKNRYGK